MSYPMSRTFVKRLFGISPTEATFARRGFDQHDSAARCHLERIGYTFLHGYTLALEENESDALVIRLNQVEPEVRGFAFEGAAMALALLDRSLPWSRSRLQPLLTELAQDHIYMLHVGIGWAFARLPFFFAGYLSSLHPLLRWLAIDGFGFHQGYFYWRRYVENHQVPKRLSGYARHVFDQGIGRSLWFIKCAHVRNIASTIDGFPLSRRTDLWSGVGLACAYAGGVEHAAITELHRLADSYLPQVAQGAAFAAKARQRANIPACHTEMACEILCGMSSLDAARVTDTALDGLVDSSAIPAYEIWRRRIQAQFG